MTPAWLDGFIAGSLITGTILVITDHLAIPLIVHRMRTARVRRPHGWR